MKAGYCHKDKVQTDRSSRWVSTYYCLNPRSKEDPVGSPENQNTMTRLMIIEI